MSKAILITNTTGAQREQVNLERASLSLLLSLAADELIEHNNEYQHITRAEFIEELRKRAHDLEPKTNASVD